MNLPERFTVPEYPKRLARISAVLILIGSLIWVQWPVDFERFGPGPIILFVGSLVAWLGIELADWNNNFSKQNGFDRDDVNKINHLLRIIDKKQFYILRESVIETYMDGEDFRGLKDVLNYRKIDVFPFHNVLVRDAYERFCALSSEFLDKYSSLYTSDGNGRKTWRPSGGRHVPQDRYDEIMLECARLSRQLYKISEAWEGLIKVSRENLNVKDESIKFYEFDSDW